MGFYTDFSVDLTLRPDTPAEVVDVVRHMAWVNWKEFPRGEPLPSNLPDHPFFQCERWNHMMATAPAADRKFDGVHLQIDGGSFKNYDDEIAKFTDWIAPYCVPQEKPILKSENEDHHQTRSYSNGRRFHRENPDFDYDTNYPWGWTQAEITEEELERSRWIEC